MDVGVVVNNVGTAVTVARAIQDGEPLIQRVLTVTGPGVRDPGNLLVRIGTPIQEVVEQCGGLTDDAAKAIAGGPMMGVAQVNLDIPVVKGTSGILVLPEQACQELKVRPCIGCARCVDACPVHLLPTRLERVAEREIPEELDRLGALDCIECGCCAYICPANRPLVHWIRYGKALLQAARRQAA